MEANSLVIRGGNVVTEDAILPNHDIVVENGRRAWWLTGKLVSLWWMRVAPMWFQA